MSHPPEGNGWDQWKNLVLDKLEEISSEQKASREERVRMREDLATLKAQGRLAGAIAGILAGVLASLGIHIISRSK